MEKIVIFGNTGFVGSWLTEYLISSKSNIKIYGYALRPNTNPSIFKTLKHEKRIKHQEYNDILNIDKLKSFLKKINPDKIIYLASQPIVKEGLENPKKTFLINNIGLINFFESIKSLRLKKLDKLIIFTSDKVYENKEKKTRFKEEDSLGGSDPYSASKACQEIISKSYFESYFRNKFEMTTLRAGNIIGGGDWAQDRIIPDIIRSIFENSKLKIRNKNSVRPWQHVLDVCEAIKIIMHKKNYKKNIINYNIGINSSKMYEVIKIVKYFENYFGKVSFSSQKSNLNEKKYLSIDAKKFLKDHKFKNMLNFRLSNEFTCEWYRQFYNSENMISFTKKQILLFKNLSKN